MLPNGSLLSLLLVQKMVSGWWLENSFLYASLVVMVRYGNLPMIKAFSSIFVIMEEKAQQSDKSGCGQIFHWPNDYSIKPYDILDFLKKKLKFNCHWWFFSNVVAATDLTLLALAGIGLRHNKVGHSIVAIYTICQIAN